MNNYEKVCRSNLNRPQFQRSVIEVSEQSIVQSLQGIKIISLHPEFRSTYEDTADDYSVNIMDTEDDPTTPSQLLIQYRHSKLWVMEDSGSSTSLVTEKMAKQRQETVIYGGAEQQNPYN